MDPKASVLEPTMPKGTLQDGIDSLWKFQLRKENAALLESYEGHTKLLQSLAAESLKNKKDFDERIAALENTVRNIQSEERKDRCLFGKYNEEMATLKAQMSGMMDRLEQHDQQFAQGADTSRGQPSSQGGRTNFTEVPNNTLSTNTTMTNTNTNDHPITTSIQAPTYTLATKRTPMANTGLHTTNHAANTSADFTGPMTRSRSRSKSRSTSAEPPIPKSSSCSSTSAKRKSQEDQWLNKGIGKGMVDAFGRVGRGAKKAETNTDTIQSLAAAPKSQAKSPVSTSATSTAEAVKIPRLHQGTNSLKIYLDKATAIFLSLPNHDDPKLEIEFIALFIKGMRDADERNILVAELQQAHSSRTKKDGKIEVLCKWTDVGEGMEATGLFKVEDLNGPPKRLLRGMKLIDS